MTQVRTLIDRANIDPTFHGRLKANPATAFREAGVELPSGAAVEVIDGHRGDIHLLLGARTNVPELDRIAERADNDATFKELLLHDPRAAVEDHLGRKLPPSCNVHVREAVPNTVYVYLAGSQDRSEELTDDALEAVSGGLLGFALGCMVGGLVGVWRHGVETEQNEWQEFLDSF